MSDDLRVFIVDAARETANAFRAARRIVRRALRASAYSPEESASCMMHVYRCSGREAVGNVLRCHPDADPGGYHIGIGMLTLPETYATREEAVDMAKAVAQWVAIAIQYDRDGLFGNYTQPPDEEFTPELPGVDNGY
jgi:hypothetical protein